MHFFRSTVKAEPDNNMTVIAKPSRHYTNTTIETKYIVIHCMGYKKPLEILDRYNVSCHYLVPEQTNAKKFLVYEVVKLPLRAKHAGISRWKNDVNLNDYAIGIEVHMPNYGRSLESGGFSDMMYFEPYQAKQIVALQHLVKSLQEKYQIPAENIIGHSDIAPWRNMSGKIEITKTDPGPTFPWEMLAKSGIGIWPKEGNCSQFDLTAFTAQKLLSAVGYYVPQSNQFDLETNITLGAARLRWDPRCFNSSAKSAKKCYEMKFDQDIACRLSKVAETQHRPLNASFLMFLAAGGVGGLLVAMVLICALVKYYIFDKRNNAQQELSESEETDKNNYQLI